MKIVIAGGTGFLGSALSAALARDGHDVVVLTRGSRARPRAVTWTPNGEVGPWASEVNGAGAIVNLAGESIASGRWSPARKQRIRDSRIRATRSLASAMLAASASPPVFISGSAVGYYGPRGDEPVTEETSAGSDFLADVCVQWEAEAMRAASDRTRVVCIRTGVVIEKDGGALPQMALPFKLFAGGPVGSGRQYMPWIHRDDWVGLVRWAIVTASIAGPLNLTGPQPVTNAQFAHALGAALHRPAFMKMPALPIRVALGEMADALLLSGQRALPAKAERGGYQFKYATVDTALRAIYSQR
jgi:uncharacterized protein (TIGR01777 family)